MKLILLLLGAILAASSCRREPLPGDGWGGIVLSLNSSHALRLETKGTAENLLDGSLFNNVLVILTDNSGKVIGKVYNDYGLSPLSEDVIEFDHLLPGNYHAYAYANIDATQWQKTGGDVIASQEKTVSSDDSFTSFLDRELLTLTTAGRDVPANPVTSMLLTGKLDIPVGLSVVEKSLDLLRPVVRFKVTVRNNTRFPVTVNELGFSHFNPDKAYLLDHFDASGVPAVPDGVTYRELPAFDPSSPSATVPAESEAVVYTTYLYENAAPSSYKIFTTLTLDRSGESLANLPLTLGETPFGAITAATLNGLNEGETVNVVLINPRDVPRSGRLYYGIGASGKTAWESCGYTTYDGFLSRARAIYDQSDSAFPYKPNGSTLFSYTGAANNKSGLAGWTGDDNDAPYTGDTFDYNGKRSTYFHTLTKGANNLFTLDGLGIGNPASGPISNIRIVQGKYVSGKMSSDFSGAGAQRLVKIINNSTGQYLKSDCAWSATTDDAAKNSTLIWDGGDNQDNQFLFIGKFDDLGGQLKRLLSDNNKEVPLTYMARNEEINVIVNVFYADQEGSLQFVVDNEHWTDAAATTSTHTFN